jgi:hypothetical protein
MEDEVQAKIFRLLDVISIKVLANRNETSELRNETSGLRSETSGLRDEMRSGFSRVENIETEPPPRVAFD